MIHFLIAEGHELPKITSHNLCVPFNPKYVRILSWFISFFFYFNCLPDDVLRKMMFCYLSWWCCSQLIMWQTIWLVAASYNLILKSWKCNTRNIKKCDSASNYILTFGKMFHIYKLIHIALNPRILISSFLLAS